MWTATIIPNSNFLKPRLREISDIYSNVTHQVAVVTLAHVIYNLISQKLTSGGWGCGSAIECLPSMHEALSLTPSTT